MEKIDYKKEYQDLYMPKKTPMLVDVPDMPFIMIQGKGNPNEEEGEYQEAISLLYGLTFTIKMSKLGSKKIPGYFEYVVPPLEGLWWMKDRKKIDFQHKEKFEWVAMIRQPEFVTQEVFHWACQELEKKKGINSKKAEYTKIKEGLCVQCMHRGPYDEEPETVKKLEEYIQQKKLENAIGSKLDNGMTRNHHEIYLSDPRRTAKENLKTVIRIPVKEKLILK